MHLKQSAQFGEQEDDARLIAIFMGQARYFVA
jgi:hypothetical protein